MKKYVIAGPSNYMDLAERVNALIAQGYEPIGNLIVSSPCYYMQALLKRSPADDVEVAK